MKIERHSPSSLNLFCASQSTFVLEKICGKRQPVGAVAHRGTAVEYGISKGLFDPAMPVEACIEFAQQKYRQVSALCGDPRVEASGKLISDMVRNGLDELRPYGVPTSEQQFVSWHPDDLTYPIVGYYDFAWDQHGIVVDLKTTERMPSQIKNGHARQVALYAGAISDNVDARLAYVTHQKRATYRLENVREHRDALHRIARVVERFLALSDDPAFFVSITAPDVESFYWSNPAARAEAFATWGI